ncbi:TIGR04141 family sporadically distributed protein [Aeromonas dhakensis]|uniref:TIGR04141 family sporadically distributed protein n=1 Tax=Aeromonas dhakensis TaxID=196024 RepID=UPI00227C4FE2|nr:TIGR04141 family sporadically distributed protein [Aeromonas dhakensis]WAF69692.1 TIGR04141 family sporadically distributed protein [Aeromonas dhakensis]
MENITLLGQCLVLMGNITRWELPSKILFVIEGNMPDPKPYRYLNTLLAKAEYGDTDFREFLSTDARVIPLEVSDQHGFEGILYIKIAQEKRPYWAPLADAIVGRAIDQLSNKSSSAVLLIRVNGKVLAFTFGYGRFLLNIGYFEQDFGLKTALNTLNHQSLRSVELHTLEDQPIQKKSQATRDSDASVFGIDIFRDVLRAVTGSPRVGIGYKNISGGDAIYSFGMEMLVEDIPKIAADLLGYYNLDLYKKSFSWVDNIRRVKDTASISALDDLLLAAVKRRDESIVVTLPEIIEWDSVLGFSFTRSKRDLSPTIDTGKYLENIVPDSISVESIRRDRLYITDIHDNEFAHSLYECLYFELDGVNSKKVIFGGNWYEIDKSFMNGIDATLALIELSDIPFPSIEVWDEGEKKKIEAEGDYNERVAVSLDCYLLDKKLVKCSKTTSPIELCDLLTKDKKLIHVKHRKGGSAGLSHLFAQGSVSAEVMLGDRAFRKEARKVLRRISHSAHELIPIDGLKSSDYEVVFLILGDTNLSVKENLPFFSKVNLTLVFENLSQRGYEVKIAGAEKVVRDGT